MAVKGAIRVVVLVIPHTEQYSRHQDMIDFRKISLLWSSRHLSHVRSRLRRVRV